MIETARQRYLLKLDEINLLAGLLGEDAASDEPTRTEREAKEEFFDILLDMYGEGFAAAAYMLGETENGTAGAIFPERLTEAQRREITEKRYDGVSIGDKFTEHYENKDAAAMRDLVNSEAHRCYTLGSFDKTRLSGGVLIWKTVGDEKVRDTHWFIDGMRVKAGYYFYTFDGDYARFPGDFTKAENNANCRCWLAVTPEQ